MLLRNTAEQPRAVATSVKKVMNMSGVGLGIAARRQKKPRETAGLKLTGLTDEKGLTR
jgi:hypothetical protein